MNVWVDERTERLADNMGIPLLITTFAVTDLNKLRRRNEGNARRVESNLLKLQYFLHKQLLSHRKTVNNILVNVTALKQYIISS